MSGDPAPSREAGQGVALGFSSPTTPGIAKPIGAHASAKGRGCDLDNTSYIGVDLAQITSPANRTRVSPDLPLSTLSSTSRMVIAGESTVRFMSPVEHERAQGFTDNYTLVPYRGRMMANGPRQHMIGNSMPVNMMAWIGERIAMVDRIAGEISIRVAA